MTRRANWGLEAGTSPVLTKEQLAAAHSWEAEDVAAGRPAMTEFRRRLRFHQSWWREAHGHPIGSQPIAPRPGQRHRLVGSRLPLSYGHRTGAQFVTHGALQAARDRTDHVEPRQSFDHQRFWADLLWSPALAVNLFGELAAGKRLAQRAFQTLWPGTPGMVSEIRFAHSPGWMDPMYLNSLRAFDAMFIVDLVDGGLGIVATDAKYHEPSKPETPRPSNLPRYSEVAQRSGVFARGALDALKQKSELAVM
jgi:hypothetical protein